MNGGGCTRLALASVSAAILLMLSGCDSREAKVEKALAEFQVAQMSGDLEGQQRALSKVVQADETNAQAWTALGQIQIQRNLIPEAYTSFTRALEFDRDNADILRSLIGLALRVGQLDMAERHVQQLDLVAPGDAMVLLTRGLIALQRRDLDEATTIANKMVESGTARGDGMIIKSQVLLRQGKEDDAVALMESELRTNPQDNYLLRSLAGIYERRGNFQQSAALRQRLWEEKKADFDRGVEFTAAALRAGQVDQASAVARELLTPGTPSWRIEQLTNAWLDWPGGAPLDLVMPIARAAPPQQQLSYAIYLNRARRANEAAEIAAPQAQGKVNGSNVRAVAIMAESLAIRGQYQQARDLISDVVAVEPDNVANLRAKTIVELEAKDYSAATNDARRLVSLDRNSDAARLLLAETYVRSGDREEAIRSLWDAFQDTPTSKAIYAELRDLMIKSGKDVDGLEREYREQVNEELSKDMLL